jgi:long-subunit fatty acid transport protein
MKNLVFFVFLSFSLVSFSQKSDFWDNVQFGGGFTIGFGNQTIIGISPSAIYRFDNGFSLGTGVNYLYSEINDFSTSVYGTSLISLYQTNFGIQFSGELEYYFAKQQGQFGALNTNFPAFHLGIAYNQGRFAVGIRYDVLYDENKSVFASPISPVIRFYF